MMISLSNRERKVFEAMIENPNKTPVWDIDMLGAVIYEGKERPTHWRKSVVETMTKVRMKTALMRDRRVVKVSKNRGRGNKAVYALNKTARRLVLTVDY